MPQNLDDEFLQALSEAVQSKNTTWLLSQATVELHRIANAQEAMVNIATADMNAQIEEAVQTRAEKLATEMDADKTKRSFLGRKG